MTRPITAEKHLNFKQMAFFNLLTGNFLERKCAGKEYRTCRVFDTKPIPFHSQYFLVHDL